MTPTLRRLAEFDGWIFSSTGNSCQRGRNGTARRLTDLHYHDKWEWLMPVYTKLCGLGIDRECMIAIQSAILLNDIEMTGELCGRVVEGMKNMIKPNSEVSETAE